GGTFHRKRRNICSRLSVRTELGEVNRSKCGPTNAPPVSRLGRTPGGALAPPIGYHRDDGGASDGVGRPQHGSGGNERMAREFTVILEASPGTLAQLGTVLGDARVNIEAIQGMSRDGRSVVRFIPRDLGAAARALNAADIAFSQREVLIVRVLDEPGTLGEVALVMAHAGINIEAVRVPPRGAVALGVDALDGALQVAGGWAGPPWEGLPSPRRCGRPSRSPGSPRRGRPSDPASPRPGPFGPA